MEDEWRIFKYSGDTILRRHNMLLMLSHLLRGTTMGQYDY
jgi:hypothetical protein